MAELTEQRSLPQADVAAELPADGVATVPATRAVRVWQAVFVVVPLLFIALLALRLYQTNTSEQRAAGVAPDFTFTTFDGEMIALSELRGQGVVLNFWASWCDPCRDEAVLLEQTWQAEKEKGIVFLGLDYLDQEPQAKAYLDEYRVSYPNGPDLQSKAARDYGIKGVPETFFIDGEGKIAYMVIGPIMSPQQMEQGLSKIRP
ncbi:MAG TPA: TlpA disulfide reductase family protein [Caldilineaceae bacterium]|nr:TlpA disulfide reductase family protein [Caldilineaceae bacterium]